MNAKGTLVYGLVALLFVGCTGLPPTPTLVAPTAAAPEPTREPVDVSPPDQCGIVLVRAGAFSQRTAEALASLRTLVIARDFDSAEVLDVVRRVSALRAFDSDLPEVATQCELTAALSTDINAILIASALPIQTALFASFNDPALLRSAAVALWKLLPLAVALNTLIGGIASTEGVGVTVAAIPDGASDPLGKLPPITTAAVKPSPTPRPVTGGSTGNTDPPKWLSTANAWETSVYQTYGIDVPTAISELWGTAIYVPGLTPQEIAARKEEAKLIFTPAVASINAHLSFMNKHPAATCFADGYRADRGIADTWLTYLPSYLYPDDLFGQNRAAAVAWTDALATMNSFVANLPGYFKDC